MCHICGKAHGYLRFVGHFGRCKTMRLRVNAIELSIQKRICDLSINCDEKHLSSTTPLSILIHYMTKSKCQAYQFLIKICPPFVAYSM